MSNESKSEIRDQKSKILFLFTRTPLHVGAGSSVGAIDQPIIRERHTGFPVIPASSLKGTFADAWNDDGMRQRQFKRVIKQQDGSWDDNTVAAWLFGSDDANHSFAGALQFSEAKLLAFPVRSAKGSFAWITCPLILARAARNGVLSDSLLPTVKPTDEQAIFSANGPLSLDDKIVLEEYTFSLVGNDEAAKVGDALKKLFAGDRVWQGVADRLVILSDGMMSFFAENACEVAQHVRISDETGTAEGGALFNQENVPSETMFYAIVHAFPGRGSAFSSKTPQSALDEFEKKIKDRPFQFGGDASTGLGWCSLKLDGAKGD
ncbi:MAG TPA: type III-B CRISPR module RAMP protein Cmr4 [Verrucomicrobiae bacterium]|jgi:CRISPR-associated protein Cmr4|nr:type III-B CRISPR module RAMP protein Cmr4 [Verrucomicrobiae bacterium]